VTTLLAIAAIVAIIAHGITIYRFVKNGFQ
jgi:hypothetical protein